MRSDHHHESGRAGSGWLPGRNAIGAAVMCVWLAAPALTGCKSTPPPPPMPTPVTGSIQGASELNPSVNQRPSPVLLRVYELKSPTAFNQADFMALYQADQATLGADLVERA